MKKRIPAGLLSQLSRFVDAKTALHVPADRWRYLEDKVVSAALESGFNDEKAYIKWLVSTPLTDEQMGILASHITNTETYFWREPKVFEAFEQHILPDLVRHRENGEKLLRIWSAGCSSGEEPYSVAIALRRALPAPEDWSVTILATDINTQKMQKAMAGIYTKGAFRNAPPWLMEKYFIPREKGRLEIRPEIRKMVKFAYLNLAEEVYPSKLNDTNAMDIIFCRNVLMYFTQERAIKIGHRLGRALRNGGWMVVSSTELSSQLIPQVSTVQFPGAMAYRKESSGFTTSEETFPERLQFENAPVLPPRNSDSVAAKERNGRIPQSISQVVRMLANKGNLTDALALCDRAIADDLLNPGLHYLGAIILLELSREGDADAFLKRALHLDPDFVMAHFTLGNLALRRGDRIMARKCFDSVLELLGTYRQDALLPDCEGLTAGRFREMVNTTIQAGALI
jgi:chemotaxis protein methyltransferase CheR